MLRGSELCVMLSLGKGMVKIALSKNCVNQTDSGLGKPVCPQELARQPRLTQS